jgi:hypothetical protein
VSGDYLLRFWGRDADLAVERLTVPAIPETDENNPVRLAWFATAGERDAAELALRDLCIVHDRKDGPDSHKMTFANVTLVHEGREYRFRQDFGCGYPPSAVAFMYEDGNFACDCNRSLFIQRECAPDFPFLECGDAIALLGLEIQLEDFNGAGKPAGRSSVGAKAPDPQGWPTQVACPSDNNLTPHTTAAQESSSVQPVVNSRGVATATGPSRGL